MSSLLSPRGTPSPLAPPKTRLISDLGYPLLKKLSDRLDVPGETNWRKLISELPGVNYDQTTVEKFGLNGNRVGGSPSYALLTDLSNRGIAYDVLIMGLKRLNFGVALNDLGYREEIKLKVQPVATPAIEGQRVELRCEATGVPPPAYLWFKGREPLGEQLSNTMVIERVVLSDAAMYTCRVSNDVNTVFSNWAEIIIQKPPVLSKPEVIPGVPQVTDRPVLHRFPEGLLEVSLGAKLLLSVEASDPGGAGLTYQWMRDTKELKFGSTSELLIQQVELKDLGTYNCRVTSDLGGSTLTPNCVVTCLNLTTHESPIGDTRYRGVPPTPAIQQQFGYPPHQEPQHQQQLTAPVLVPQEIMYTTEYLEDYHNHQEQFTAFHAHVPPTYPPEGYYDQGACTYGYPVGTPADEDAGGQGEQPDLYDLCYDKVALLVGNKNYHKTDLQLNTPDRDAQDLAGVLQSAGFKVVSLIDLSKREMEKAVQYFTTLIGKNVYALFFFAGHGFEYNAMNYMMPVDADVEKKPEQCVCAQHVLQAMQERGAKLSIMILDMCRVSASTHPATPVHSQMSFTPSANATGYFLLAFSCTRAERAYEASTDAESLRESDKNNSIFVSALKEHLDAGTLNQRLDTLLTDAAAKVRDRGRALSASAKGWMRPEIRHNMAGPLSLADEVKRGPDTKREERAQVWQRAHIVPDSVVVGCQGSEATGARPSEIALRLHFEAEHSNVLIVTAELLNGCLAQVEVHSMSMALILDGNPHHPKLMASDFDKEYRYSDRGTYRVDHIPRPNDILHFRIPGIQKIRSSTVTLEIEVHYTFQRIGSHRYERRSAILTTGLALPLYAHVTVHGPNLTSPSDFSYHGNPSLS